MLCNIKTCSCSRDASMVCSIWCRLVELGACFFVHVGVVGLIGLRVHAGFRRLSNSRCFRLGFWLSRPHWIYRTRSLRWAPAVLLFSSVVLPSMPSPAEQLDRARKDELLDLTLRNPLLSHTLWKTYGVASGMLHKDGRDRFSRRHARRGRALCVLPVSDLEEKDWLRGAITSLRSGYKHSI